MSASEEYPQPRRSKGTLAICLLVGTVCLVVGAVCGGGFMAVFYIMPNRMSGRAAEVEALRAQAMEQAARAQAATAMIAVDTAVPMLSGGESEKDARSFFENLRAGRAEALLGACTTSLANRQTQQEWEKVVAKYPLPPRTLPIGGELTALPPIDEKTHQYIYKTTTRDGLPVQFTITIVKYLYGPQWQVDQFVAEELGAESGDHSSH